jgi:hypothetical protein
LDLATWFCRKRFKEFFLVYFYSFAVIYPWRGAIPFIGTNLNLPRNDLCQVWLKLVQYFWRRFLKDLTLFLHFCDYLPFEEDLVLLKYLKNLKDKEQFVLSFIEFGQLVLEKKI